MQPDTLLLFALSVRLRQQLLRNQYTRPPQVTLTSTATGNAHLTSNFRKKKIIITFRNVSSLPKFRLKERCDQLSLARRPSCRTQPTGDASADKSENCRAVNTFIGYDAIVAKEEGENLT